MNYRLGGLSLDWGSVARDGLLLEHIMEGIFRGRSPQLIERTMRAMRNAPDLLESLPPESEDRYWVEHVAATLEEMAAAKERLTLDVCEGEPGPGGYLAVGVYSDRRAAFVRLGDLVNAGFVALRSGTDEVEVFPRIYRKVCANGAVVLDHTSAGVLAESGTIAGAIERCLGGEFDESMSRLRSIADVRVEDPLELLRRADIDDPRSRIAREFSRAGDRTAWGLVNAVTARARDERRFPARLEAERGAGRIVDVLLRSHEAIEKIPAPARS